MALYNSYNNYPGLCNGIPCYLGNFLSNSPGNYPIGNSFPNYYNNFPANNFPPFNNGFSPENFGMMPTENLGGYYPGNMNTSPIKSQCDSQTKGNDDFQSHNGYGFSADNSGSSPSDSSGGYYQGNKNTCPKKPPCDCPAKDRENCQSCNKCGSSDDCNTCFHSDNFRTPPSDNSCDCHCEDADRCPKHCDCCPKCDRKPDCPCHNKPTGIQLQLENEGSITIANGDPIIFNSGMYSPDIAYNSATGQITIKKPGNYLVTWWVATIGAGASETVTFEVKVNNFGGIPGSSPIVTGQVNGTALINVVNVPVRISLVNATGDIVNLASTPVQANITITELP